MGSKKSFPRETSTVYVISCVGTDFVKVGISHNAKDRIKNIQACCPIKLEIAYQTKRIKTEIAMQIEKRSHYHMKEFRGFGEWFSVSTDEAISSIEKSIVQVRNKRGEFGNSPSIKSSVNLGWKY